MRVTKRQFADSAFAGLSASKTGGRWTSPGQAVVYTTSSLCGAVLEMMTFAPHAQTDYVVVRASMVPSTGVQVLTVDALPAHWNAFPRPPALVKIGDEWLAAGRTGVLSVPSAVLTSSACTSSIRRIRTFRPVDDHCRGTARRRVSHTSCVAVRAAHASATPPAANGIESSFCSVTSRDQHVGERPIGIAIRSGVVRHTGSLLVAAALAKEYGFTDIDGKTPRPLTLADV